MEAEEEEEEVQGGLGDFGFGRQADINDQIDEAVSLDRSMSVCKLNAI